MFGVIHHRWLISFVSSTIIQDIKALCEAEEASMAYFYFDFRNASKQGLHDLVTSLLTQLSARSTLRCDILSNLYSVHDNGKEQPGDDVLTKCLKDIVTLPDQRPVYLIMDALDESPDTSGLPSPRERVLQLLKELVDLRCPNLHMCHKPPRNQHTRRHCSTDFSAGVPSRANWTKGRYCRLCQVCRVLEFGANHKKMEERR